MPNVTIDGIDTYYEVHGEGPPLLMFSPGGFDAKLGNWVSLGIYRRIDLLARISRRYRCITFDRREAGRSGSRIERLSWRHYAAQGLGLLDHLGVQRAHVLGGCVGCSVAAVLAVEHPERVASLVLYSPAGGARYRLAQHERFARHLSYVVESGLGGVVELARTHDRGFSQDPRVGPWVTAVRSDDGFAAAYAALDVDRYRALVSGIPRTMFDRDSVPGPEPEDLLRLAVPALVVPGRDASHATSAARFLEECLPASVYWDVPPEEQTADNAPDRVLEFLDAAPSAG